MKYLVIAALFSIGFPQFVYSAQDGKVTRSYEMKFDSARKYVCYEFGITNIISVFIADGDSVCDVSIFDGKNPRIITTCKKTPLLEWTFDNMADEMSKYTISTDKEFKPFYYQLSLLNDSCQTVVSSTTLSNNYSKELKTKIEELKSFMIKLWYSEFLKR